MERSAAGHDLCCQPGINTALFPLVSNGTITLPDMEPINQNWTDGEANYRHVSGLMEMQHEKTPFSDCTNRLLGRAVRFWPNITVDGLVAKLITRELRSDQMTQPSELVAAGNRKLTRLSCQQVEGMWFDLMNSYGDMGGFLSVVSLIGIILYFVTSSDSGSLVIDCLSANGDPDPPAIQVSSLEGRVNWGSPKCLLSYLMFFLIENVAIYLQRVFWALTEGATATALLVAGGNNGLNALQTVSIIMGLPYTVIVCFMCVSLYRLLQVLEVIAWELFICFILMLRLWAFHCSFVFSFLQHEMRELNLFTDPKFRVSLLDPFATWNPRLTGWFFLNIFIAPYTFGKAAAKFSGTPGRAFIYALPFVFSLFLFIILHICAVVVDGLWSLAWISFLAYAGMMHAGHYHHQHHHLYQ